MSEKERDETERDEADRDDAAGDEPAAAKGDDEGDESASSEEEAERALRVAEALGVAPEEGEGDEAAEGEAAEAKPEEPAAPPNRAQRRREEAMERRRKRKGLPPKKEGEDALPKDKNKRAKELLQRRRESAAESKPAQLDAGEMVDDALARAWAGSAKWARKNLQTIQWVVLAALVGVGGYVGYTYFTQQKLGASSGLLASGAMAEDGFVIAEEKDDRRSEDDKEYDPSLVFKSAEERADRALESYRKAQQEHPGTGAALLAKLGEAGVLLDKRDWDGAAAAYDAVLATPLAAADPDVKGRAIEGLGFVKEGKGDLEGATAEFRRLETLDAKGYKELSQYHQARMLLAKNTDDARAQAKDLLKAVYDKLKEPALDKKPMPYLQTSVEQALRALDPSLVADRGGTGSVRGGQMSQEELQQKLREIQEKLGKTKDGDPH